MSQYISEKQFKLNNEIRPKSNPEFLFVCAISAKNLL